MSCKHELLSEKEEVNTSYKTCSVHLSDFLLSKAHVTNVCTLIYHVMPILDCQFCRTYLTAVWDSQTSQKLV